MIEEGTKVAQDSTDRGRNTEKTLSTQHSAEQRTNVLFIKGSCCSGGLTTLGHCMNFALGKTQNLCHGAIHQNTSRMQGHSESEPCSIYHGER